MEQVISSKRDNIKETVKIPHIPQYRPEDVINYQPISPDGLKAGQVYVSDKNHLIVYVTYTHNKHAGIMVFDTNGKYVSNSINSATDIKSIVSYLNNNGYSLLKGEIYVENPYNTEKKIKLSNNLPTMENISHEDMMNVMETVITRLVNEGVMEIDNNNSEEEPEEEEKEYHFIWENGKAVLMLLNSIASDYDEYSSCDIEKYDAWVEFGSGVYIIVSMDDDGYIYVSKVESYTVDSKQESAKLWKQVGECINRINELKMRPCDVFQGKWGSNRRY